MRDNQLYAFLIPIINAGLIARGISATVKQSYQPTPEGINVGTLVTLTKISENRYGFLKREDVWNAGNGNFDHVETQVMESHFQVGAFSIIDPKTETSATLTAADVLYEVTAILQSDAFLLALKAQGIGVLRIQELRNPYFSDDRERFEASPSFDFTITHKRVTIATTPKVDTFENVFIPV